MLARGATAADSPFAPHRPLFQATQCSLSGGVPSCHAREERYHSGWAARLSQAGPRDILVLNAGAHYTSVADFRRDVHITFAWLRRHFRGTLVYRDFYAGIPRGRQCLASEPECSRAPPVMGQAACWGPRVKARMDQLLPPDDEIAASNLSSRLNAIAEQATAEMAGAHFMRAAPMMAWRCDRTDPIHFCTPGAATTFVALLHQLLHERAAAKLR